LLQTPSSRRQLRSGLALRSDMIVLAQGSLHG
jgi:hypothetical protein